MIPFESRNKGFSLIELMCSMLIASMILLVVAGMLAAAGDSYERIHANVENQRDGRTIINQLVRDLSTSKFQNDFIIQRPAKAWSADRLGFLTLAPDIAQSNSGRMGDLCAVVYYVKDLMIRGKTVRCVMRGFRESTETFNALEHDNVPSLYLENSKLDEPIAIGVISFETKPMSKDASGKWIDWIENSPAAPDAFELRMIFARTSLAKNLKQSKDWDGAGSAGILMGEPRNAERNEHLKVYSAKLHLERHETH